MSGDYDMPATSLVSLLEQREAVLLAETEGCADVSHDTWRARLTDIERAALARFDEQVAGRFGALCVGVTLDPVEPLEMEDAA